MLTTHSTTLNTITPCAACKLLRRRCAAECPFSPYFSPHEPQKFACVHKVFGASNVSKMLMEVPMSQRAIVASSLVYEANARLQDPVYGCVGILLALQHHAHSLQAELNAVRAEIEIMRYKSIIPNVGTTKSMSNIDSTLGILSVVSSHVNRFDPLHPPPSNDYAINVATTVSKPPPIDPKSEQLWSY